LSQKEKQAAYSKACYEKHKEERRAYGRNQSKLYREKNSDTVLPKKRDRWLLDNFKRTPEWYEETLKTQGDHCALCDTSSPEDRRFQVDHDHKCCPTDKTHRRTCGKCVRGLLCEGCNTELGSLERLLREFPFERRDQAEVYLRNSVLPDSWTHRALQYLLGYAKEDAQVTKMKFRLNVEGDSA